MSVFDVFGLSGRVAVVTGGGTGLGRAASIALAQAGAHVVVCGRTAATLQATVAAVEQVQGSAQAEVLDVSDPVAVDACFARLTGQLDHLDVLVNNAAVEHQVRTLDQTPAEWDRVVGTNLNGTFHCAQAFARADPSGPRSIINISSFAAVRGVAGQAAYCASKGGIDALSRSLALEFCRADIRVNVISPGYFDTDMPASVFQDSKAFAKLTARIPMHRLGDPREIGPAIIFLASAASSYMTGTTLYVDGGYITR